jgi:DNA-binding NtrC family response regulator
MKHLLVIDDDAGARASLRTLFETDYRITLAASADEGMDVLQREAIDLVFLDVIMPQKDGLTLLQEICSLFPDLPVIMVSATDRARPIVESMQRGAVDFVTKPFDVRELRALVIRTLEQQQLRRRSKALESEVNRLHPLEGCIGESAVFQEAVRGAKWASRTDVRILIQGEAGTGKEMLARQIHHWSPRQQEPFVAARCTGASPEELDVRIFGKEGPGVSEPGKIDLAGAGTLFLKDIDALPSVLQEKMEHLLQEGNYTRLGGQRRFQSSVRIITSSSKDLGKAVADGSFRKGLLDVINVAPLSLPPLRKRREDIPGLISFFLTHFRETMDSAATSIEAEAEAALVNYDWPGNIRELRLVLERVLLLHMGKELLERGDLPPEFQPRLRAQAFSKPEKKETPSAGLSDSIQSVERQLLMQALRDANGVQTRAAKQLGITRRILKYKMDKLNITLPLPEE